VQLVPVDNSPLFTWTLWRSFALQDDSPVNEKAAKVFFPGNTFAALSVFINGGVYSPNSTTPGRRYRRSP